MEEILLNQIPTLRASSPIHVFPNNGGTMYWHMSLIWKAAGIQNSLYYLTKDMFLKSSVLPCEGMEVEGGDILSICPIIPQTAIMASLEFNSASLTYFQWSFRFQEFIFPNFDIWGSILLELGSSAFWSLEILYFRDFGLFRISTFEIWQGCVSFRVLIGTGWTGTVCLLIAYLWSSSWALCVAAESWGKDEQS